MVKVKVACSRTVEEKTVNMRLTKVLMYYIRRRHIPGKIDNGKHRIVPHVLSYQKKKAMVQLVEEQKNMDILNNPYLSQAEDYKHEEDMGLMQAAKLQKRVDQIEGKWLKHRHMEERFENVERTRNWE